MTTLVDGRAIARKIQTVLKKNIEMLPRPLGLSIYIAGDDAASLMYTKKKMALAQELGITVYLHELVAGDGEQFLEKGILRDAKDPEIDGIIVQLPLPEGWNRDRVLNLIPPEKDVDVLTREGMSRFRDEKLPILPPVVGAIQAILEEHHIAVAEKDVLVIGRGRLVGQPTSLWLRHNDAHVTMVGNDIADLSTLTKEADVIISGAGSPKLIKRDMISEKTILLDAGTSEDGGSLVGDVDSSCRDIVQLFSPVPGGIGPLTVVMLLKNLYILGKGKMV